MTECLWIAFHFTQVETTMFLQLTSLFFPPSNQAKDAIFRKANFSMLLKIYLNPESMANIGTSCYHRPTLQ